MAPVFKRKNPADAAAEKWRVDLDRAKKRASSLDDDGLVEMVRESGERPLYRLEACSRLAASGRIDLFRTMLCSGEAAWQLGGIDGACTAACNGRGDAVELLADLPGDQDPAVRLRAVESLAMVADGTPGDLGSSTEQIRQAAASIIERFVSDSDSRVSEAARSGLYEAKDVDDVRRAPDQLTYLGRRVTGELLTTLEELQKSRQK